jgi:uncharacterized protein (DUF1800 family)
MNPTAIALNRFGLGARPDQPPPERPQRWLLNQFERYLPMPAAWADLPRTAALVAQYFAQQRAVRDAADSQKVAARQLLQRDARETYVAAVGARAASSLDTPAPFAERLVHFWANHFAVSIDKLPVVGLAGAFEADAIRPHVLGRFEDMLVAVTRHPAMLLYLDQANSIGPQSVAARRIAERGGARQRGLNENLAREIMELHTLGVRSGYTQSDVTEFARALTGWSIAGGPGTPRAMALSFGDAQPADPQQSFQYRPALHEPGSRTIMGRVYADAGDGQGQARAVLRDLATSPATARHIAFKLARHFVADEPSPALVERLATAFQRGGGDLPAVYRALVESPEAWAEAPAKFKTPWEWAVSGLRGLGRREMPGMQMAAVLNQLGQPLWRPGSPAGYDDIAASWAAPDALLRRVELAQRIASNTSAVDARALAPRLLSGSLSESTAEAIARAESPASGLALLLVCPEFLRR